MVGPPTTARTGDERRQEPVHLGADVVVLEEVAEPHLELVLRLLEFAGQLRFGGSHRIHEEVDGVV